MLKVEDSHDIYFYKVVIVVKGGGKRTAPASLC